MHRRTVNEADNHMHPDLGRFSHFSGLVLSATDEGTVYVVQLFGASVAKMRIVSVTCESDPSRESQLAIHSPTESKCAT